MADPLTPERRAELLAQLAAERRRAAETEACRRLAAESGPGPRVADLVPAAGGAGCPSLRQLEDHVAGRLSPRRATAVRHHLLSCPACGRYTAGLRRAHEAAAGADPTPRGLPAILGPGQVAGLAIAGILLLIANSAVLDLLAQLPATAVAVQTTAPRTDAAATLTEPATDRLVEPSDKTISRARPRPTPAAIPTRDPELTDEVGAVGEETGDVSRNSAVEPTDS